MMVDYTINQNNLFLNKDKLKVVGVLK
jgi:hypothetical protein